MSFNYREIAFEEAIELYLTKDGGYEKGKTADYDAETAIDKKTLLEFIKTTQADEWDRLKRIHKDQIEKKFLYRLTQELNNRGMLDCLRKGIVDFGVKFKLMFRKPTTTLNANAQALYDKNALKVYRQVRYSPKSENSIDLLIGINGLPIITVELKNPLTYQTVENAKKQYKEDRDPKELIFQFKKRALVHFAVDTDEVFMTTRLKGSKTYFLPFNKGNNNGAGNPDNPMGYKTSYLWEEVLKRDSIVDIISRFLHISIEKKGKDIKESLIFPRYHQLNVVRKLVNATYMEGTGENYLIQHSAGSGKSNSIAWLAHRLATLHGDDDNPIFNSVIVISDRRILDKQLQDTIFQFDHKQGLVEKIDDDSTQLANALENEKKIIITTLQKFPYLLDKVGSLKNKKFAIIVDEAHSSQSGESVKSLKQVLSGNTSEDSDEYDAEEEINKSMESYGRQANLNFYAFTATPKHKTLEIFGKPDKDGNPKPFHLYSMRQAIEEGFILDVLQNYTTYKMYYKLSKQLENDPNLDKKSTNRAIARFVSLHPHNIAQKVEVIIEHFKQYSQHKISGKAKAMVVTSSRLHAVRYKEEFDKYIEEKSYTDIKALIAFSGTVKDDIGNEYKESEMNGFSEKSLPKQFSKNKYNVLIVADKYQTGFDQPLLHTMYVDKKLRDVKAVQTLSRLNRTCEGKEDTFILDFVNEPDEIKEAFQPYYKQTLINEVTDPNLLFDFKHELENFQVFIESEIEEFCKIFFKPSFKHDKAKDHAKLNAFLDPSVSRYRGLEKERQHEFKTMVNRFIRLYSYLAQIVPFNDIELHKLYSFLRFLIRKLPRENGSNAVHLDNDVALEYYKLQKMSEGNITLESDKDGYVFGSKSAKTSEKIQDNAPLSEIIDKVNDRFGTEFTEADKLFVDSWKEEMVSDETLINQAKNNSLDNYKFAFNEKGIKKLVERMNQNQSLFKRIINDTEFREYIMDEMLVEVYEQQRQMN